MIISYHWRKHYFRVTFYDLSTESSIFLSTLVVNFCKYYFSSHLWYIDRKFDVFTKISSYYWRKHDFRVTCELSTESLSFSLRLFVYTDKIHFSNHLLWVIDSNFDLISKIISYHWWKHYFSRHLLWVIHRKFDFPFEVLVNTDKCYLSSHLRVIHRKFDFSLEVIREHWRNTLF